MVFKLTGRNHEAVVVQAQIPGQVLYSLVSKGFHYLVRLGGFAQLVVGFCHLYGTVLPVVRHVVGGNHLFGIVQGGFCLVFLALTHQLLHELGEDATVRVTHAHGVLVDIDARLVDATELELVHQVVVHLFGVYCHARLTGVERSETIGKTFLNEVVLHVQLVLPAYADSDIDGAFPVGLAQHLEHHQLALVEGAFAFQRNVHVVGD